jgi:hypothetical protein
VVANGAAVIKSKVTIPQTKVLPSNILEVLEEWGCTWIWEELQMTGGVGCGLNMELVDEGDKWLSEAISDNSLVAVTDGSFIREICPHLCSAALILECTKGRGRLVLSLSEPSKQANAYRGELLGLMAVHLILLAVNKVHPTLPGSVQIFSDCLGALNKVEHLPPHRILSRCRHSDILKTIMLNCTKLSFIRRFSHVKAHQDDWLDWNKLSRPAQLNCACDIKAKSKIQTADLANLPPQRPFPMEPLTLYVGNEKMTTDSGATIRFAAHKAEARAVFHRCGILNPASFDKVWWEVVHSTLHSLPTMFAVWACKQVFGYAATYYRLNQRDKGNFPSPVCPCCTLSIETTGHILFCQEEGRSKLLTTSSNSLLHWMLSVDTSRDLVFLIVQFVRSRGNRSMEEICREHSLPEIFLSFAMEQDDIGWRRFMEGMVARGIETVLNSEEGLGDDCTMTAEKWTAVLVQKLLEMTHGMWIYRNLMIHDGVSGVLATSRKEKLQEAIEHQLELGGDGLREEDKWMMEVNLGDLSEGTGERECYWLLAIQAAREHRRQIEQRQQQQRRH